MLAGVFACKHMNQHPADKFLEAIIVTMVWFIAFAVIMAACSWSLGSKP